MGRGPTNENTNMYFQARKKAATYNERLWSREGAAELLGISVSTLADYELGNTKVVPVDKVVLMADLYNAPELITGYCMRECPVHGFLPLATEEKSLEGIALRLLQNFKHRTWPEGKAGFVTSATEKELIVQYHPGIGNVTNHFRIPIDEAVDAQWEIRYSHDMSEVKTYGIEKQDTEEITEASADQPVVYCRLISSEKQEETNTVAWMDGRIAVHVLCPENTVRLKMAADIANHLSFDGEVIMLDYSPMFIKRLQVNYKSDYLKEGQVFITGHYGLLRYKAKPHVLTAAHGNYS